MKKDIKGIIFCMGFNLGQSDVRGFTWNREKKPRNLCQID